MTASEPERRGVDEALAGLRRTMRKRRIALSRSERRRLAAQIAKVFRRTRLLRPGRRVCGYQAVRGEADPMPILETARRLGCRIFLPRVTSQRRRRMEFLELADTVRLRLSPLGLWEPATSPRARTPARRLDLVLVPLVAFDPDLNRLGMGAGYFDRQLAFLRRRSAWRRPKLVGIAYEFQHVASLPARRWDVPLDLVVTERAVHRRHWTVAAMTRDPESA